MVAANQIRLGLSVLIYREEAWWIAHCLEMDLPAEGKTPPEALLNLFDIANVQIEAALEHDDVQSIFSPAPAEFGKLFAESRDYNDRPARPPIASVDLLNVRELTPAGV